MITSQLCKTISSHPSDEQTSKWLIKFIPRYTSGLFMDSSSSLNMSKSHSREVSNSSFIWGEILTVLKVFLDTPIFETEPESLELRRAIGVTDGPLESNAPIKSLATGSPDLPLSSFSCGEYNSVVRRISTTLSRVWTTSVPAFSWTEVMSAITLVIGASIERLCSFAMLCRRRPSLEMDFRSADPFLLFDPLGSSVFLTNVPDILLSFIVFCDSCTKT